MATTMMINVLEVEVILAGVSLLNVCLSVLQ